MGIIDAFRNTKRDQTVKSRLVLVSLIFMCGAVHASAAVPSKTKLPIKAVACPTVMDIGLKKAKKINSKVKGSVCKVLPFANKLSKTPKKNQDGSQEDN